MSRFSVATDSRAATSPPPLSPPPPARALCSIAVAPPAAAALAFLGLDELNPERRHRRLTLVELEEVLRERLLLRRQRVAKDVLALPRLLKGREPRARLGQGGRHPRALRADVGGRGEGGES